MCITVWALIASKEEQHNSISKIIMRLKTNLKNILHFGARICLVVSFLTLTYISVVRYLGKRTNYHVSFEDEKNILYLDDQFFFFTHPGILNLTFPCTTTLGGTSPGKPCVFPIIERDDYDDKCMYYNSAQLSCFTNIGENNEYKGDSFDWGYCPKNCNGEVPGPTSHWNLAKSSYSNIWTSFFYDF